MSIQGFATIAALGIGLVLSVGIFAYEIYNTRSRYYNYQHASSNTFTYDSTSSSSSNNRPIPPSRRRRRPVNDAKACVVCLENFTDDKTTLKTLLCGHSFHCICIDTWFAVSNSCPVCRANSTI